MEEDIQFLLNMMGPRAASLGGSDKFAAKRKKLEQRKKEEQQRQLKEQERLENAPSTSTYVVSSGSSSEDSTEASSDPDCSSSSTNPTRIHRRRVLAVLAVLGPIMLSKTVYLPPKKACPKCF